MKRIKYSFLSAVAVLVAIGAGSGARAAIEIKLRAHAAPYGSVVRLADVAEISADDRQQARQLGALPLMPSPAPGTDRYLWAREIQNMIAAQGVETGSFRFTGAEQVAVAAMDAGQHPDGSKNVSVASRTPMNRHAAILAGFNSERPSATQLDDARTAELRQQLNGIIGKYLSAKTGKYAPWKIDFDVMRNDLARLNAAVSTPVCSGGSDPWTGRQRFMISFSTADGPVQLPVVADASPPPVPVVVAVRPISRGDVITAADIELRTVDVSSKSVNQKAVDSVDKLIGMEARQAIQVGDVVLTDEVQSPILVKRGDVVTVSSQSGGIRVRTTAKALHDGARGDLVQVESLASQQKYDVRVVGMREAAVFTISRPAMPAPPTRVETARR
jgi:flagella basal body P-ring formation protein FlgA